LNADVSPFEYANYEAIIRFATPVYDVGELQGIVVLSLDHRHLMEKTNHINSTTGEVVWPEYASGNYAYMLDYQGWLIAHPNLATLRGLDENGDLMPTQTLDTLDQNLPFNMLSSDIKDEAIQIASAVLAGEEGNISSENLEGALKVDIYVPISFEYGVYKDNGFFGGLVLSENVQNVEKAGEISKSIITNAVTEIQSDIIWITGLSLVLFISASIFVSRSIINPVRQLMDAARIMEKGELDLSILNRLLQRRFEDEVTELTRVFKQMAEAVQLRVRRLREEVRELRIQIDETQKQEEVDKIVKSESFKTLQEKARKMRARRRARQEKRDG
jgi:methyl-accepting chemotaxis protein